MRTSLYLPISTGIAVLCLVLFVSVTGMGIERTENVGEVEDRSFKKKPPIFSFIRGLLPNPEKTLETLKAAAEASRPKAKTVKTEKNSKSKNKEKLESAKKEKYTLKRNGKPVAGTSTTTTTTPPPRKIRTKKIVSKTPATTTTRAAAKSKSVKFAKDRPTKTTRKSFKTPPAPRNKVTLSRKQKRDRLRQELVKETEENCLAKILCGNGGGGKPTPKEKNAFVSDSAHLIKEFFNIFDFTDEAAQNNDEAEVAVNDGDDDEGDEAEDVEEAEDDTDDEEDEVYNLSAVEVEQDPPKKKYSTNKPKKVEPISKQPSLTHKRRTPKPLEIEEIPVLTRRPKPMTTTSTTTAKTTTTLEPPAKEDGYGSILTLGDMAPFIPPFSNSKLDKINKNRVGQPLTLTANNFLMNTLASTSMSGSVTLKPFDLPFEIPVQTGKDTSDDEEDDNNKYSDDRYDQDSSTYHRVTLEELVGDIKLTPEDLAMFRRGRSMRMNVNNVTSDKYIRSKLRQMNQANNDVKKLRIAQKIGRSMREPGQCQQFSRGEKISQTCPLTSEVVRFFNSNLKNGSSEEVKKTSDEKSPERVAESEEENDKGEQPQFAESSPEVTTKKVESTSKKPSPPSKIVKEEEEEQWTVPETSPRPTSKKSSPKKSKKPVTKRPSSSRKEKEQRDSEEEQDDTESEEDEEEEEEEDEQEDTDGKNKVEEDEEEDEEDEDYDEDENGSDDSTNNRIKKVQGDHQQIQGSETNQPNEKVIFRPQPPRRPSPPQPTLPPGHIHVYGVPQPSFDKDFSVLADQLGPKPLAIFGEEDIDRPAYKRRRQLPGSDDDDDDDEEKNYEENVAYNSRIPKHPPLGSEPVFDGEDDDDDDEKITTKKPYKIKKKHPESNSGKPLGGLLGGDGDDDDDDDGDDDDDDKESKKKKKKVHSIESVDLNESPFSATGFYSSDPFQSHGQQQLSPRPHEYLNHPHQNNEPGTHHPHQVISHHQHHPHHSHSHHHHGGPHHPGYGYRPIVRPIKIIPDVQVPPGFRPTRANMRPGRLYPVYGGR